MNTRKKVSIAVVKRLPRYYRYLYDLLKENVTRISSKELSQNMGITASQIRQDLNCFGGFGQQGYGYNVHVLYNEIGNILGANKNYQAIIIGAGNMGRALANYRNFEKRGYEINGIFDVDMNVIGQKINGIVVMPIDKMDDFIKNNNTQIAILTVPHEYTKDVAERAAKAGIKALWNFSAIDLQIPDVVVENVHLSDSLMVLGYRLKEATEENEFEETELK